jgi:uncharacterized protein
VDLARLAAALVAASTLWTAGAHLEAQVPRLDESDRAAFRAWFTLLADAQFYRPTPDVTDCAALVRHAAREAFRTHDAEWLRRMGLPVAALAPDLRARPAARDGMLPMFRVSGGATPRFAEFADARTILTLNAVRVGRESGAARPGDLLAFHQPDQDWPDHLMVFVGRSALEPEGADWVVYHTGGSGGGRGTTTGTRAEHGEVRKVRLGDLLRHPSARWRPDATNPHFVGVFRLTFLAQSSRD